MLKNLKKNYILLISTFLIIYFIFNLMDGDRGLFSYFKKKNQIKLLSNNKEQLIQKIDDLEFKNMLIKERFDLDYLEILIRDKFTYGKKNEKIYIIKDQND